MNIDITNDLATPAVQQLQAALTPDQIKRVVGGACVREVQQHLNSLPANKRGWPSTGFYKGAARGTGWDQTADGISILIDNAAAPGAMRQRFHGGEIHMKDKHLAIPAREEFSGHSPTEFTNLRLAVFRSGAMALVIGKGGVGQVNFETGREKSVSGAGVRSEAMVAYWLVESVSQEGDPTVIPSEDRLADVALRAVFELVGSKGFIK